jgi:hypothetical protein
MATLACTSDLTAGQQEGSKKQEARSKKQEASSLLPNKNNLY